MRRAAALLVASCVLSCAALLSGCWNGRVLYAFERPFLATLGDEAALRFSLYRASMGRGYFPRFDRNESPDPLAIVLRAAASGYAVVVVGPLLSFDWNQFVPGAPGTTFILVGPSAPAGPAPRNAVFLSFDRAPAFREAGRIAGESVRASDRDTPPSLLGARVGVLTAERSGLGAGEAEAFAAGVADALDGARPVSRALPALPDAGAVRGAISQMRAEGVAVFLLGLGERDPVGLEALHDGGGTAVVSDWQSSGAFAAQVLASVEEDVPAGVARALAAAASGTGRAEGPVRVVRGRKI